MVAAKRRESGSAAGVALRGFRIVQVTVNPHALAVLEFPRVLDVVAGFATSTLGAARVRALTPSTDIAAARARARARCGDARGARRRRSVAPRSDARSQRSARAPARRRQPVDAARSSSPARRCCARRAARRRGCAIRKRPAIVRALLAPLIDALIAAPALEARIERTIQEDGTVKDDASAALRRIRRELRAAQGELIRILEREMEQLEPHHRVADSSVTMRNGRYVIPVRREGRAIAGGIVHDTSASGATLFVEPPAAVEFGNRMRELESDEIEEVERILLELTDELRPRRDEIIATLEALVELDCLYARARFANAFACAPATLVPARDGFDIRNGRHPLLLAQGADVVPFDLAMDRRRAHAARLRPEHRRQDGAAQGARADLGARAVRHSRAGRARRAASRCSTTPSPTSATSSRSKRACRRSARTSRISREILRLATADSLVVIDELGSGTDPVEGAALGWAILEELTARGTMTVATTHLGTLKELASRVAGVVNASLQFDARARSRRRTG